VRAGGSPPALTIAKVAPNTADSGTIHPLAAPPTGAPPSPWRLAPPTSCSSPPS